MKALATPDGLRRRLELPYYPTKISLHAWHVDMLDAEGKASGFQRRSGFMNALVRRHAGMVGLERGPARPAVQVPRESALGEEVVWVWNVPRDVRRLMDKMAEQCGGLPAKAWVMILLFDWLGLPPVDRHPQPASEQIARGASTAVRP